MIVQEEVRQAAARSPESIAKYARLRQIYGVVFNQGDRRPVNAMAVAEADQGGGVMMGGAGAGPMAAAGAAMGGGNGGLMRQSNQANVRAVAARPHSMVPFSGLGGGGGGAAVAGQGAAQRGIAMSVAAKADEQQEMQLLLRRVLALKVSE